MVQFSDAEYHPELGCYMQWIYGKPSYLIDQVYSLVAFHQYLPNVGFVQDPGSDTKSGYNKYPDYLLVSTKSVLENTSNWIVRIYIDESVFSPGNLNSNIWKRTLQSITELPNALTRVQIICVRMPDYFDPKAQAHLGLLPVLFRFLTLFDPTVRICLFRDIDNIWTDQHQYFVDKWISSKKDVFLFMNDKYARQEIIGLDMGDVVLGPIFYKAILSGLWNIRKDGLLGEPDVSIWQKIFAYAEEYTNIVNDPNLSNTKYAKVRCTYGFDELALTRVVMPYFIDIGLTFQALPIRIYDLDYYEGLFSEPAVKKFLRALSPQATLDIVKQILIQNYWHMTSPNAGLSQYILSVLSSVYYLVATRQSKLYKSDSLINAIKDRVYPVPVLMGVGLFTFKNYDKYTLSTIKNLVFKFVNFGIPLTLDDWTAGSDLSNNGDGPTIPDTYLI